MGQMGAFISSPLLHVLFAPPLLILVDFCWIFVFGRLDRILTKYFYDPVTEMLLAILSICSQEELVDSDAESDAAETAGTAEDLAARQIIKNKILAVGRMQKVFQLLRYVFFFVYLYFIVFCLSIADDSPPSHLPLNHAPFFFSLFAVAMKHGH